MGHCATAGRQSRKSTTPLISQSVPRRVCARIALSTTGSSPFEIMPKPFGRLLVFSVASAVTACGLEAAPAGPVTFARDVAPIVFERCGVCHHPNGSAPFSLLTYAAARPHATQIAAVTKARVMPPWKSEPGYGDFIGHRPLIDDEIRVLQQWVEDGAPEGDPADLPAPPHWTDGWQLGTPDLVVSL